MTDVLVQLFKKHLPGLDGFISKTLSYDIEIELLMSLFLTKEFRSQPPSYKSPG